MAKAQVAANPDAERQDDENLFADKCIDLLCRQEKTLWLLGEKKEKANNDDALELTWEILIQFLDFAEVHFSKEEFGQIAGCLHCVHEHTVEHKQRLNTRSWRLVRKLVGLQSPGEMEMSASYHKLGKDYEQLFETFFAVCRKRFPGETSAKARFDESVSVFLAELNDKW